MSTRCLIGISYDDHFETIYCHWDGYPEGVGRKLLLHYNSPELIEELLGLGSISSLGTSADNSIAYVRDRGEDWKYNLPQTFDTYDEVAEYFYNSDCEYLYLFDTVKGEWVFSEQYEDACRGCIGEMQPLNLYLLNQSQSEGNGITEEEMMAFLINYFNKR